MRDATNEREKRLVQENKQLKREREVMFTKITALNPDDPEDMTTLKDILSELKNNNNATNKRLLKENAELKNQSQNLQKKFKSETTTAKSKLYNRKAAPKGPVKKAAYLAPSKQVEVILNQSQKSLKDTKSRKAAR